MKIDLSSVILWGTGRNLNKVFAPRAILMAEGAIIVLRRSHARIVKPRLWHITKGGHTVEKEFQRGGYP